MHRVCHGRARDGLHAESLKRKKPRRFGRGVLPRHRDVSEAGISVAAGDRLFFLTEIAEVISFCRRHRPVSLNYVGGAAQVAGDHARAAEAYGESLEVRRDLAERLKTPESLRDLSVSLDNVGRAAGCPPSRIPSSWRRRSCRGCVRPSPHARTGRRRGAR